MSCNDSATDDSAKNRTYFVIDALVEFPDIETTSSVQAVVIEEPQQASGTQ